MVSARFCVFVLVGFLAASAASPVFYEPFEESYEGRWIVSGKDDYKGTWKHERSEGHDDYGLLVSEKAKKYGIVYELPKPVELKKSTVVLQYDLRLQDGLECGGAYLKFLLPQEAGWTPKQFDSACSYSIMFGPDKCGATNKVHFIFRHKNPKSGAYLEHHLKSPPSPTIDKLSHVYTAVILPDNTVKILIDGEEKKTANLLSSDFEPSVVPPKTIPDPNDVKPEDWDERDKIADPGAKKPDDWDEDAPLEIEDLEAEKPEGWLDDEPEEVEDPEAVKPDDWDDDEDGEWEAPKIPNAKCEEGPGCGEWKRPKKRNPAYKGKWYPPMIDNPNYKGIWKPQQIPNPDYFELEHPNLEPIAAIGIEIWTMQDGILFDNFLIANSEAEAAEYRDTRWKLKYDAEKKAEKPPPSIDVGAISNLKKQIFEVMHKVAGASFLAPYHAHLTKVIEKGEENANVTLGILFVVLLMFIYALYKLLCGGKAQKTDAAEHVAIAKKEDISSADDPHQESKDETSERVIQDQAETSGEAEKEGEATSAPRHRRARRET